MASQLPSPVGARLSGDDYQHAITWLELLRLLRDRDVVRVRFEVGAAEAGIVDDLVIERVGAPSVYCQIKLHVDDSRPLTHTWFTTPSKDGAKTPLQRFYESFRKLRKDGENPPELQLLTSFHADPGDPLLKHRSNRHDDLWSRAMAAGNSKTREALQLWRDHLGLDDEEFREFLQRFKILSGLGSLDQVLEHCSDRMRAVGLKGNEATIRVGIAIVRDLIGDGVRELDRHALCKLINRYELPKERPVATLLIQEIDHRPHPQLATASVDWVEEFYGDSPDERRRPKDATCWDERFLPDLRAAIHRIRDARFQAIRLDGAFRLPTAFTLGRELNERTGVEVLISASMNEEWSTAEDPPGTVSLESEMIQIGEATGLAVALSISGDIGANVKEHLIKAAPETAGRLLVLKPQSGCGRHAVAGAGQARAMAEEIVDELRSLVHDEEIHLFLSCPKPLAVVLGHVWNRLPAGWVYADLNPGYARSYRISST